MAGTALVAHADRDERLSELVARDRILARLADLLPLNTRDAVALYERYARRLDDQPDAGRREVLEKIGGFDGSRDDLLILVRACLAIGHADRDFSARERSVVEEICRQVGIDPAELGVYDI
jgi:tellurite resistance protein